MSYLEQRITLQSKIDAYKQAIEQSPNNPKLYNAIAILYEKSGEFDAAIAYYKEAIRVDVNFVQAYNNIGVILYKQARYMQAIEMFKLSLGVDDKFVSTYINLGAACNKAGRLKEGEEALLKAIMIDEDNSGAYANLGNIYNKMKRHDEARIQHEMALMLDDKSASNYANIGITYKNLFMYDEAKAALEKAIMIDPYFVNAHFDLATTYLTLGEYKRGFSEYEWRFKKPEMRQMMVDLEDILKKPRFKKLYETKDKTLLLYTEQGFGDILQFSRFAKELKAQFPDLRIRIQVRKELKTLFQRVSYFDAVYARGEAVGDFDYQLALMSLPHLLALEKEAVPQMPYIDMPEGNIDLKVDMKKLNIGVVWGASNTGESYEDKVFSLKHFKPLMEDEALQLYSLQVGGDVKEIEDLGLNEEDIINLESKLTDFKQTALALDKLDFVITSDTSVAHLAGALGKEAWVVLQKNADWRWGVEEDVSYWYPSLKLIRQEKQGDWESAFKKLIIMIEERKQ
jgi:tetratricopeptide (TPR) repeat protein